MSETIPNSTDPKKVAEYDKITRATPDWQLAKKAAERDDRMNASLNRTERDAFGPINRALDRIIELNILGRDTTLNGGQAVELELVHSNVEMGTE